MPLYKYVTYTTAINILAEHTIRFTQPCEFNDPFEFLPQFIRRGKSLSHIESRFDFSLDKPCREGIRVENCGELTEANNDEAARVLLQALSERVGVLCLTRNPLNLLMWAHYCGDHKGAVIELDEKHPFFVNTFPVSYSKKRPIYELSDFMGVTVPLADFYIKSDIWEYEQEVRISKPLDRAKDVSRQDQEEPVFVYELPSECILGVTLGARMQNTHKQKLWSLVKETHIYLEQAVISNWDFELRKELVKPRGKFEGTPVISPATAGIFLREPGPIGEVAKFMLEDHPLAHAVRLPTTRRSVDVK